jgi:hypothetical protein
VTDELRDRLDAVAEAGARGIELTRPDPAVPRRPWWRGRAGVALAAAVVAAAVGTTLALTAGGDGADDVETVADPPPAEPAAVVAVTYADGVWLITDAGVDLRFVDPAGNEIARRNLNETADSGGGLLQPVPSGPQELVVTHHEGGRDVQCTQSFDARPGDRLILRVQPPGDDSAGQCAPVETVADWVAGYTGPAGEPYVGLSQADAEARAAAAGLTTRVVGLDGAHLVVTMELRTDRLNLMVFDDVVVAARLDAE